MNLVHIMLSCFHAISFMSDFKAFGRQKFFQGKFLWLVFITNKRQIYQKYKFLSKNNVATSLICSTIQHILDISFKIGKQKWKSSDFIQVAKYISLTTFINISFINLMFMVYSNHKPGFFLILIYKLSIMVIEGGSGVICRETLRIS